MHTSDGISRRAFLAVAAAAVSAAGCNTPGSVGADREVPASETLVIESGETYATDGTETYAAVEWHSGGTLVADRGAGLEITKRTP